MHSLWAAVEKYNVNVKFTCATQWVINIKTTVKMFYGIILIYELKQSNFNTETETRMLCVIV